MVKLQLSTLVVGICLICLVPSPGRAEQRTSLTHPGALNSAQDFQRMSEAVRQGRQPWAAEFARLRANTHDSVDYQPHPVAEVIRGTAPDHPPENYALLFNDAAAAYALALDWRISGDSARAAQAVRILTVWGRTLRQIGGTGDKYLASGIYGYELAVAGETLRDYPGWSREDREQFEDMLVSVFAPMNIDFLVNHAGTPVDYCWANWDLANIASLMAIGVFADRRDLYDRAKDYYLHGSGNGSLGHAAWKVYPGGLAQWQESGRDQAHTLLGLGLAGIINQIAWQQGDNLFAAEDNRLLAAARYIARYNLGMSVPYTPFHNSNATQSVISPSGRGQARPIWALLYAHYVQEKHLEAPELAEMLQHEGLEGGGGDYGPNSGGFDQLGYGTLTFLR
jgi:hypothetical protein